MLRLPVEVLPGGDGQRAAVSAWTEQHVSTVWVSFQQDFSLCPGHGAKTPAPQTHHASLSHESEHRTIKEMNSRRDLAH